MKVLCVGAADCMQDDVERALALFKPDAVLACNDAIALYPGEMHHGVSQHAEKFNGWLKARADNDYEPPGRLWTSEQRANRATLPVETVRGHGGGSGMLMIHVARAVGAKKIVLAGIPMARDYGHAVRKRPWDAARLYQRFWIRDQDDLRRDVRSVSGLTAALLGPITDDWLHDATQVAA